MYEYNDAFYRYINAGSSRSAAHVIPNLFELLPVAIQSVLDVGCGAGAWLQQWAQQGVAVTGLDGDYVEREKLLIPEANFVPRDLAAEFDLQQRFSLVQSLEVAEHLPVSAAAGFVASLCRHSDIVLFSAAPPGQGGEHHVNEQPYAYWRDHFAACGYTLYDALRPRIAGQDEIMPWYRYNCLLFVSADADTAIHEALAPWRIADDEAVPDCSPWLYRQRKRLIALLPSGQSTQLAIMKRKYMELTCKS